MLEELQRLLVAALRDPDPAGYLRRHAPTAAGLDDAERRLLLEAQPDGLRLSRVLIRKLRLQRVLRSDPGAAAQLAGDPEGLARRFAAYDAAQPMRAVFPAEEGEQFRRSGQ